MSDTALNTYATKCANNLATDIFPALVQGLAAEGHITTVDKLIKMANVPVQRSLISAVSTGIVPSHTTTTTTKAATGTKGKAAAAGFEKLYDTDGKPVTSTGKPFIDGKHCEYWYPKGAKNKGKICGKEVQAGTRFCKAPAHQANKSEGKATGSKTGPGIAPQAAVNPVEEEEIVKDEDEEGELSLMPYMPEKHLYTIPRHDFVVFHDEIVDSYIIGKLNRVTNTLVALNENERKIADKFGLSVEDSQYQPVSVQQTVPIQTVPVQQTVPIQQVPLQQTVPIQQVPLQQTVPIQQVPLQQTAPIQQVPLQQTAPIQQIPFQQTVPIQQVPLQQTVPIQQVPVQTVPLPTQVQPIVPIQQVPFQVPQTGNPLLMGLPQGGLLPK